MKWAKTLVLATGVKLEKRLMAVVEYILKSCEITSLELNDLDATGSLGNLLSDELWLKKRLNVSSDQLLSFISEDGQILEMDLWIHGSANFRIIVVDGQYLDVLGETDFPTDVIGEHVNVDVDNY